MKNDDHEINKWISVKDSMPPNFVEVLLLFESGGYYRRRMVVGYWWGGEKNEWMPATSRKFNITHWMPLPNLPSDV